MTLSIIQYLYYETTFQNSDERVLGVSGSKPKLYHYSLAVLQVLLFAPGNTILNIIDSCEFKVPHWNLMWMFFLQNLQAFAHICENIWKSVLLDHSHISDNPVKGFQKLTKISVFMKHTIRPDVSPRYFASLSWCKHSTHNTHYNINIWSLSLSQISKTLPCESNIITKRLIHHDSFLSWRSQGAKILAHYPLYRS